MIQNDRIFIIMITSVIVQSVTSRKVTVGFQPLKPNQIRPWNGNASLLDPCVSAPCLNAGTCITSPEHPYHYACQCVHGYTGTTCDKGLDECAGNPCLHGACVDDIGSFRCHCYPGFTGELCDADIDECRDSPCQNGGTCHQPHPGLYACQCPSGYRGNRCETDIDECLARSPCQNGGVCRQGLPGAYVCDCIPGFTGIDCETKVLECSSGSCQNGGLCVEGDEFHSYRCHCAPGNTSLCGSRGRCLPAADNGNGVGVGSGGYRCLCVNGEVTNNRSCEDYNSRNGDLTPDPCKSSPCQNGGHCSGGSQDSYRCQCRCRFTGAVCQTALTTLDHAPSYNYTNRCQNGGVCFTQSNDGQTFCVCPSNFTGQNCDIPINQCTNGSNPCLNNGTCRVYNESGERFYCQCMDGFTGESCQLHENNNRTTTTTTHNRGFPYRRSAIDPTLLLAILGILGTVGAVVGVSMLLFYFYRRQRPRDFCFSIPARPLFRKVTRRRQKKEDSSTIYSSWIVNSDAYVDGTMRDLQTHPPPITFYQSSSDFRRF